MHEPHILHYIFNSTYKISEFIYNNIQGNLIKRQLSMISYLKFKKPIRQNKYE